MSRILSTPVSSRKDEAVRYKFLICLFSLFCLSMFYKRFFKSVQDIFNAGLVRKDEAVRYKFLLICLFSLFCLSMFYKRFFKGAQDIFNAGLVRKDDAVRYI